MRKTFVLLGCAWILCAPASSAVIVSTIAGFTGSERRVVDYAVDYWERLIADPLTLQVSFSKEALGGDLLGESSNFLARPDGLPRDATVRIDDREGSGFGWFVDATPGVNEEFLPGFTPYHQRGRLGIPAGRDYDLLTVLLHELAHVFGFSVNYSRFGARLIDANDGLRNYTGANVNAVLAPAREGTHLSDAAHPNDLLIAFQSRGERVVPSDLDLAILSDAFGYNLGSPVNPIPEPSTFVYAAVGLALVLMAGRRFAYFVRISD
jgi:hypothetical protein